MQILQNGLERMLTKAAYADYGKNSNFYTLKE